MAHATVQWKPKPQSEIKRGPGRPRKDFSNEKYTRLGYERLIHEDEVKTPTEGFERQFGKDFLVKLRRLSLTLKKGETQDGITLLQRTRPPRTFTVTFVHGGRLIFVTLAASQVVCFGCDPHTAAVYANRVAYEFEPDVDRSQMTLNEKLALTKRWTFARKRHADVEARMNFDKAFRVSAASTARYDAYAKAHGLRIVSRAVELL